MALTKKRKKGIFVGAPKIFLLELACKPINDAFGSFGCYLVGSSLERRDWRDIDVRFIMEDEAFFKEFPNTSTKYTNWEFDVKWILINSGIAAYLTRATDLPIDFQIQPQTYANERYKGRPRNALGLTFAQE